MKIAWHLNQNRRSAKTLIILYTAFLQLDKKYGWFFFNCFPIIEKCFDLCLVRLKTPVVFGLVIAYPIRYREPLVLCALIVNLWIIQTWRITWRLSLNTLGEHYPRLRTSLSHTLILNSFISHKKQFHNCELKYKNSNYYTTNHLYR